MEKTTDNGIQNTETFAKQMVEATSQQADNSESNFFRNFKSKDDLVKAYVCLEKEFTRKSQQLKEKDEQVLQPERNAEQDAERFFEAFPDAREAADDILRVLTENPSFAQGDNALERAYLTLIRSKTETREDFLSRAMGDEELRKKVILNYIGNLPTELPRLSKGGQTPLTAPKKPKTLSEAGAEALRILKK